MTPTYEELLEGATKWSFRHNDVTVILSHHGYSAGDRFPGDEPKPGTWCYYLLIPEQMYPHRWDDFRCTRAEHGFEHHGPGFCHDDFDSEITWSSSEPYFCRQTMRMWDAAKVGCDYAHLYHHERGYPDTYQSVKRDAIATVEKFLSRHPDRRLRSGYSNRWDLPERFYTARNGSFVHVEDKIPDGWVMWKPAD